MLTNIFNDDSYICALLDIGGKLESEYTFKVRGLIMCGNNYDLLGNDVTLLT